jgi:hypothetical protein
MKRDLSPTIGRFEFIVRVIKRDQKGESLSFSALSAACSKTARRRDPGLQVRRSCGRFGASYRDLKSVWNLHGDFSFHLIIVVRLLPAHVLERSRAKAAAASEHPSSWTAAIIIVFIWLLFAAALTYIVLARSSLSS